MVKVERCTCPVTHCFLKFRITDRFFVLLKIKSEKHQKSCYEDALTLWSSRWKYFGFFFKTTTIFFHEQIFSVFQTLHLVGTWKLLTATVIRFVFGKNKLWIRFNASVFLYKCHWICIYYHLYYLLAFHSPTLHYVLFLYWKCFSFFSF